MGKMGLGKIGNLSHIVPFFSDFSPISCQFLHIYNAVLASLIFPHFSPFAPIFLHSPHFPTTFIFSPFSFTSAASPQIQLRLTPMPRSRIAGILTVNLYNRVQGWQGQMVGRCNCSCARHVPHAPGGSPCAPTPFRPPHGSPPLL